MGGCCVARLGASCGAPSLRSFTRSSPDPAPHLSALFALTRPSSRPRHHHLLHDCFGGFTATPPDAGGAKSHFGSLPSCGRSLVSVRISRIRLVRNAGLRAIVHSSPEPHRLGSHGDGLNHRFSAFWCSCARPHRPAWNMADLRLRFRSFPA